MSTKNSRAKKVREFNQHWSAGHKRLGLRSAQVS